MGSETLAIKFMLIDAASAGLDHVGSKFEQLDGQGKELSKTWKAATRDFQAGAKALVASKALWNGAIKPGIEASADLQTSLDKLEATITDQEKPLSKVRAELEAISKTADTVGNPLPLDKTQVIEAATALKKMGLAIEDIQGAKGAVAASSYLAVLEGMSPEQAGEMVGDIGSVFNLLGDQYFDLSDQMSRAASASSTSSAQLGQALSFVGGSAARLGLTYKETLATLALEAKVGLKGSRGGTALEAFFTSIAGKQSGASKKTQKKLKLNFFEDGDFVGMDQAIKRLKTATQALSPKEREEALNTIFGVEGSRAASAFLKAENGLEGITTRMDKQLDIGAKVAIQLKGHQGQLDAIKGTLTSTLATGFTPMLEVITAAEKRAAGLAGHLNKAVSNSPGLQKGISGGAALVAGGLGIYGAVRFARGGFKGMSALKGLKNLPGGGLAAGVAAGKAAEQLGITSVFVTNWPGGGIGGGVGGAAADAAAGGIGAKAVGFFSKLKTAGVALMSAGGLAAGAGAGAAGIAATAGTVGAGALAGAAIGTGINYIGRESGFNDWAIEGIANAMAPFSDFAAAISADYQYQQANNVSIDITVDENGKAQVKTDGAGLDSAQVQARRQGAR